MEERDPNVDIAPNQPEASPTTPRRALIFGLSGAGIGLAVGLVLGLAVIPPVASMAGDVLSAAGHSPIESAVEACEVESDRWITVGDEGRSLSMQSLGEEADGAAFDDIFCVLDELSTPDSVVNRITSTRALDGRQDGDWDGFNASWGYHPDDGLDIIIEIERD